MKKLLFFVSIAALLGSCDNKSKEPKGTFDRPTMLRNYADNLIVPAYVKMHSELGKLETVALGFNILLSPDALELLHDAWADAYMVWQYANAYNFGPAGEDGLRKGLTEEIGTFPASEPKIQSVLSAGTWNLNDFNRDARGFLAIEYLIFGKNKTTQEVVDEFANNPVRRNYLIALILDIKNRVEGVRSAWSSSYRESFVQNAGTDVGSSTSQLYNEFVRSYESIKNFKLGLPLGKRPGQTQSEPQLLEAYYSGQSLVFLKAHVAAIEDIWRGRARDGQDGVGFREYLESVEGGKDLVSSTEAQLAALKTAMDAVPVSPSLADQITGGQPEMDALYIEFSKMTRFFKSDMSSLLGIAITFSSGDGD